MDMVISKEIKTGDIMIYAANETELAQEFLAINNLFGIGDYTLNANADEVQKLIDNGAKDEAKKFCGFFTPQCRVKMLKLRGTYSFGFLFGPDLLAKWKPSVAEFDWAAHVGEDFDMVDGTILVKAYVPKVKPAKQREHTPRKNAPKIHRLDRIIDGNFHLHYDSLQLQREIGSISSKDKVVITVKMHGISAVFGRTECRLPKKLSVWQKLWNFAVRKLHLSADWKYVDFVVGQDNVYASRTQIRNKWVNRDCPASTTTNDIWGWYNTVLARMIPNDTCIYGELIGYEPETTKFCQKNYDYGCAVGEGRFMPYRITSVVDGKTVEWTCSRLEDGLRRCSKSILNWSKY